MIYLRRYSTTDDGAPTVEIAVVEEHAHADRYEAQGFSRCTPDAFRAAWRLRDEQQVAELRKALGTVEVALEATSIGGVRELGKP